MVRSYRRHRVALLICSLAIFGAICGSFGCKDKQSEQPANSNFDPHASLKLREVSGQEPNFQILVRKGSAAEAAQYALHIKADLGIEPDANLDSVLKFCGYDALTGRDAEITPSDQLMARFPGDVVASRFFAPKIIDVSDVG